MRSPIRVFSLVGEPELITDGLLTASTQERLSWWESLTEDQREAEMCESRKSGRHISNSLHTTDRIDETMDECLVRRWRSGAQIGRIQVSLKEKFDETVTFEKIASRLRELGETVPDGAKWDTVRADALLMEDM